MFRSLPKSLGLEMFFACRLTWIMFEESRNLLFGIPVCRMPFLVFMPSQTVTRSAQLRAPCPKPSGDQTHNKNKQLECPGNSLKPNATSKQTHDGLNKEILEARQGGCHPPSETLQIYWFHVETSHPRKASLRSPAPGTKVHWSSHGG